MEKGASHAHAARSLCQESNPGRLFSCIAMLATHAPAVAQVLSPSQYSLRYSRQIEAGACVANTVILERGKGEGVKRKSACLGWREQVCLHRQDDHMLKQGIVSRRLEVPESIARPNYVRLQESPWGDDLQIHNTKVWPTGLLEPLYASFDGNAGLHALYDQ